MNSLKITSKITEIGDWLVRSGMFLEAAFPMLAGTMSRAHGVGLGRLRLCTVAVVDGLRGNPDWMADHCDFDIGVMHPVKLGSRAPTARAKRPWEDRLERYDRWFFKMVDGFVKYEK